MNKRNKIILIAIFFFFTFALVLGIYLFPDEEPMVVDQGKVTAEKITPQQSPPDADFKKKPALTASPVKNPPQADAGTSKANPYVSYPDETLFELLGIDMDQLLEGRDAFKNTFVHVEWMDRVNELLKDLDPEKKAAIVKNQTSLLYIKDKLNEAYLTGKIDHQTFIKSLADLMKWHQRTYDSILTGAEYEALFEAPSADADGYIDALLDAAPEYSFILNQEMPVEAVKEKVQVYKLEEVNSHFKKMIFDRDNIGKQILAGEIPPGQAREILVKDQQAFIAKCKEILTEDEINTIFGSVEALEAGASQTEPPKVEDDDDLVELGFMIDNPNTSIDDVTKKIDKAKTEDIKFFYQQRAIERKGYIKKLDAGEITPEELDNISKEMDAAFEENCKSTLTKEEYQLIFDRQKGAEKDSESLKKLTEQEVTQEKTNKENETKE